MNFDHLIETLRGLPEPVIEQVHEYVEFLSTKHRNKVEEEENWFWDLIDTIDQSAHSRTERFAPLMAALLELNREEFHRFAYQRDKKLRALDGPAYHDASQTGYSADSFLYARCGVITAGRNYYNNVLANPSSFPADLEDEGFLYCAEQAYESKFGEPAEFDTGIIYGSFFNDALWGEGATFNKIGVTPNAIREQTAR